MKMILVIPLFFVFSTYYSQISVSEKKRTIALLDLTLKNAETSESELFSAKHILKTSGLPFIITSNVNTAKNYGFIICSSKVDANTLTIAEKDSLKNYVTKGGILIAPNMSDQYLNLLFGISSNSYSTSHYTLKFNYYLNDPSFKWLNDSLEQTISLGKNTYTAVINSRSYSTTSTATALAKFDDNLTAITKNNYGQGFAYALGFTFKNLIIRNQQNLDFEANRFYSNGFEPTSDAVILFIKGIYVAHTSRAIWLHTSPYNSKATLIITHDIDATSAYDTMHYYSDYENSVGIKASYFFTTHYINDGLLSDFYNINSIPKIQDVLNKGHSAGSHSVGHFPDFDKETVFPLGMLGNTVSNYLPYNFGSGSTIGGTVLGETEVSKNILQSQFGVNIHTFRAGYLCFNDKLINALDTTGYSHSTTFSAADVLTNFPYQQVKDRTMSGKPTGVWEYPMTISDVFSSNPITNYNYPQKVATWLNVINKNLENNAPSVLLIHPTRKYKLTAQQDLINSLPNGVFVTNLDLFADFWQNRNQITFTSKLSNDSLLITIPSSLLPINSMISLVVDKGQLLSNIKAIDDNGNPIQVLKSNFNTNDIIVHFSNYPILNIKNNATDYLTQLSFNLYPNPSNENTKITFMLTKSSNVKLELINTLGNQITKIVENNFNEGWQTINLNTSGLSDGIYYCKMTVNSNTITKKLIVSH